MKNSIGWILLTAAIGFYGYGVFEAATLSWNKVPAAHDLVIPSALDSFTTAIGALLLTNFGAVLGISLTRKDSALASRMLLRRAGLNRQIPFFVLAIDNIQYALVILYLVSLIICLVTSIHNGFSADPKQVVPFVSQTAITFFGVLTAYLASLMAR